MTPEQTDQLDAMIQSNGFALVVRTISLIALTDAQIDEMNKKGNIDPKHPARRVRSILFDAANAISDIEHQHS